MTSEVEVQIIKSKAYIGLRGYFCVNIDYALTYPEYKDRPVFDSLHMWYDNATRTWRKDRPDNTTKRVMTAWVEQMKAGDFNYDNQG